MSYDGNYDAKVTGILQAIYVGKRGVDLVIASSTVEGAEQTTCRLDRSVSYSDHMLHLAETALLNKLQVSLLGFGDDRDDTLEYHEIRISRDSSLV